MSTTSTSRWPLAPVSCLCHWCDCVHVVTRAETEPGPEGHRVTARMAVERAHNRDARAKGRDR